MSATIAVMLKTQERHGPAEDRRSNEKAWGAATAVNGKDGQGGNAGKCGRIENAHQLDGGQCELNDNGCIEHADEFADRTVLRRIDRSLGGLITRLSRAVIAGRFCDGVAGGFACGIRVRTGHTDRASLVARHDDAEPEAEDADQQDAKRT